MGLIDETVREMPRARSAPAPSKPLPQSRAGSTYGTADWRWRGAANPGVCGSVPLWKAKVSLCSRSEVLPAYGSSAAGCCRCRALTSDAPAAEECPGALHPMMSPWSCQ